jgi:TRAP-type C4-dicarboxylate transport system permease small subunit
MKKLIFFVLLPILWASLLGGFIIIKPVAAAGSYGLNETASKVAAFQGKISGDYSTNFINSKTGQIISVVLSFVGVLFLGLMIYAGIMWMTSNGNEQTVSKSKDLIINAIIGIIIVFAAYAITSFLGDQIL